jgi:squalene-hopene/tetraprenyl-beta-curcumene cyclase
VRRAAAFVEAQGGAQRVAEAMHREGDLAALYLALAGLLDARLLPRPPLAFAALPPAVGFLTRRFHAGAVAAGLLVGVLVRYLRGEWGPGGEAKGPLARRACGRLFDLLETFANEDGSWMFGDPLMASLILPGLVAAGLPAGHPRLRRGVAALEAQQVRDGQGLRFPFCSSAVWSTAFDLRALLYAGEPVGGAGVTRALEWLLDSQLFVPQPAVNNRRRGAPRVGGWAFHRATQTLPDCDDTGAVLATLGLALSRASGARVGVGLAARMRVAVALGRGWLLGMQGPDGGWSAYVRGLPAKPPGPILTRPVGFPKGGLRALWAFLRDPPLALGDPSTEDLTGRVLHGLALNGHTTAAPEVRRAVAFLRAQQCPDGPWWGRWAVNYLWATSCVLSGLAAVKADLSAPWVRRAVAWVLDRQNADGGWGEGPESYRDAGRAGVGPSVPPLTALVLLTLLDVGAGASRAASRAVRYLLDRRRPDGTWPNGDHLHTVLPPAAFHHYPEVPRFYPLEALSRYLALRQAG